MDQPLPPLTSFEVDVDLGFALFFLILLCVFLLATIVRCAQTVVDPYGAISTSTYQEEQITWSAGYLELLNYLVMFGGRLVPESNQVEHKLL